MAQRKRPEELRSHLSFGVKDLRAFSHRSRALQMGYTREDFGGKPAKGALTRRFPVMDGDTLNNTF